MAGFKHFIVQKIHIQKAFTAFLTIFIHSFHYFLNITKRLHNISIYTIQNI